jgi:hypothetical protein
MPIVSTTTVPVVSTTVVPVVSTTTIPVVGSTSTPTLVRVKRRLTEEPNDVLVLSAKRLKSCDSGTRYRTVAYKHFDLIKKSTQDSGSGSVFIGVSDPDLYSRNI